MSRLQDPGRQRYGASLAAKLPASAAQRLSLSAQQRSCAPRPCWYRAMPSGILDSEAAIWFDWDPDKKLYYAHIETRHGAIEADR